MYERFTDRSRKVMQLANQEATQWNHDHIDTQHVLIGLIKEGSGVAGNVLKNLGVNLNETRQLCVDNMQPGVATVTTGKLPQTPHVKSVIQYAIDEANSLGHNYVGTEHLLLGLLRVTEGIACHVLTALGVKLDDIRHEILNLLGRTKKHETVYGDEPDAGPTRLEMMTRFSVALLRAGATDIEVVAKASALLADLLLKENAKGYELGRWSATIHAYASETQKETAP